MKMTINLDNLILDTGYGERDCALEADVIVHTRPDTIYNTPMGDYMGERITDIEIEAMSVWIIDQDGGDHEYSYDGDKFDEAIKAEARKQYEQRR